MAVESNDERLVEFGGERVLQEPRGRVLFEIKTAVDRAAHVNQKTQLNGQVRLPAEIDDGLRRLVVVEYGEVILVQIADKLAPLVSSDEQDVDLIHPLANRDKGTLRIVGIGYGWVDDGSALVRRVCGGCAGNISGLGLRPRRKQGRQGQQSCQRPKNQIRVLHAR